MSANGLHRNDECFSPHGFKNDLYFIVAHLFRLMALPARKVDIYIAYDLLHYYACQKVNFKKRNRKKNISSPVRL